jgi:hypothetical protein
MIPSLLRRILPETVRALKTNVIKSAACSSSSSYNFQRCGAETQTTSFVRGPVPGSSRYFATRAVIPGAALAPLSETKSPNVIVRSSLFNLWFGNCGINPADVVWNVSVRACRWTRRRLPTRPPRPPSGDARVQGCLVGLCVPACSR